MSEIAGYYLLGSSTMRRSKAIRRNAIWGSRERQTGRESLMYVEAEKKLWVGQTEIGVFSFTALYEAAHEGDKETARRLLELLPNQQRYNLLSSRASGGYTVLHRAAFYGNTDFIAYILSLVSPEQQIDLLNTETETHDTVLGSAERRNNHGTAAYLQQCMAAAAEALVRDSCLDDLEEFKQKTVTLEKTVADLQTVCTKQQNNYDKLKSKYKTLKRALNIEHKEVRAKFTDVADNVVLLHRKQHDLASMVNVLSEELTQPGTAVIAVDSE